MKKYMVIIDTHSRSSSLVPVIRNRVECESVADALKAGADYISGRKRHEINAYRKTLWDAAEVSAVYELVWKKEG